MLMLFWLWLPNRRPVKVLLTPKYLLGSRNDWVRIGRMFHVIVHFQFVYEWSGVQGLMMCG